MVAEKCRLGDSGQKHFLFLRVFTAQNFFRNCKNFLTVPKWDRVALKILTNIFQCSNLGYLV
ncbi:MAG: hypothetical protein D6805_08110 [Planctomycetota bacterium]|nr:MAG: hypothetical protein D6805_08110 [Planctomycetota bacterium]